MLTIGSEGTTRTTFVTSTSSDRFTEVITTDPSGTPVGTQITISVTGEESVTIGSEGTTRTTFYTSTSSDSYTHDLTDDSSGTLVGTEITIPEGETTSGGASTNSGMA